MKKMILTASLLSGLLIVAPAMADEAHHPGKPAASAPARMETGKVDSSMQQMQEMRKKIETTKDPATKKELMHKHMQMMRNGMEMMGMMGQGDGMMGGMEGGMMAEKNAPAMPMADRMAMMEKKMAMMEKMTGQGGGMMGDMMGGMSGKPLDDKTTLLEKKMMMMQEMMTGMMMQQEMMMK